jgi:hypothetical protein
MRQEKAPIYCGQCGALALANLNGIPLCPSCIVNAIPTGSDQTMFRQISPLTTIDTSTANFVKCKADSYTTRQPVIEDILGPSSCKY